MGYEAAPATEMVAVACAVCARPLLDAVSVESGIGPDCRRKHGYVVPDVSEETRAAANRLVYAIAVHQTGPEVGRHVAELARLGYGKLAARIAERLGVVKVEAEGDRLIVDAPYSEAFTAVVRGVPGRRFDRDRKVNTVPASARKALWTALKAVFPPGTLVSGSKGYAVL